MAQQPEFNGSPEAIKNKSKADIPPNLGEFFAKLVEAGSKFMFNEKTHKYFIEGLNAEGDLGENAGKGMANLLMMFWVQANQPEDMLAVMPAAGNYLLADAAEFIQEVTGEQVTPDVLADASQAMIFEMTSLLKVPPEQVLAIAQKSLQGGY